MVTMRDSAAVRRVLHLGRTSAGELSGRSGPFSSVRPRHKTQRVKRRLRLLLREMVSLRAWCGLGVLLALAASPIDAGSQGGQDAVLSQLIAKVGTTNKQYVEFGFDSNEHCINGGGSNTCLLKQQGWFGLLMDGGHENPAINLHKHLITSRNIVHLLGQYGVPHDVDYLSVDLDTADLWVVRSILLAGYRPRIFSVEYNAHFPWELAITFPDPATMNTTLRGWSGSCAMGASAHAFALLFGQFDYVPVGVVVGMDLFFMPRSVASEFDVPVIDLSAQRLELQFHLGNPLLPTEAKELLDYRVWLTETLFRPDRGLVNAERVAKQSAMPQMVALSEKPRFNCVNAHLWGRDCKKEGVSSTLIRLTRMSNYNGKKQCFEHLKDWVVPVPQLPPSQAAARRIPHHRASSHSTSAFETSTPTAPAFASTSHKSWLSWFKQQLGLSRLI